MTDFFHGRNLRCRAALAWLLLPAFAVQARSAVLDDLRGLFTEKLETISKAARTGRWDAYVTGYAWHAPWAYTDATRGRLNETTWGGGFGRSLRDDDGDRHSVYIMAFSDSHRATQFVAGYAWHRYWMRTPDSGVGLGYMAFIFSREDVANRWPLPAALPCVSVRWRRWEALGLFVPRVSKDIKGDVFFVFARIAL